MGGFGINKQLKIKWTMQGYTKTITSGKGEGKEKKKQWFSLPANSG